jgi:hypothetical protein
LLLGGRLLLLSNHAKEDVVGLEDLLVESLVAVEVALDVVNGQVDKHAGDLGSHVLADQSLYVGIDKLSDELLQVGVVRHDTWEHGEALLVVGVDLRDRAAEVRLVGSNNVDSSADLGSRLSNLRNLAGGGTTLVSLLMRGSRGVALLARAAVVAALAVLPLLIVPVAAERGLVALEEHDDLLDQLEGLGLREERGVKSS